MSTERINTLETHLRKFNESDWQAAIESLLPSVHEVDRNALQIWFRFYPLSLYRFLEDSSDIEESKQGLAMQGDYGLANRIDSSHSFLYGHRYWNAVKAAIQSREIAGNGEIPAMVEEIAASVAADQKVDKSLLIGITAVALMTLVQVGAPRFTETSGETVKPKGLMAKSPDSIVAERKRDDSQGVFGFLKTVDKKFSVIHNEVKGERFAIMNDQEIASASANDRSQNWQDRDSRCWEGPVPVECTSASCGTCWVGVIAGREKLSEVARRERRAVKVFGYDQTEEPKPLIRLACQAKAHGNVTIVIPPWNAVFGKKVYGNVEELELEPVTTSAKALREVVREASTGE